MNLTDPGVDPSTVTQALINATSPPKHTHIYTAQGDTTTLNKKAAQEWEIYSSITAITSQMKTHSVDQ